MLVVLLYWVIGAIICSAGLLYLMIFKSVAVAVKLSNFKRISRIIPLSVAFVLSMLVWPAYIISAIYEHLSKQKKE